MFRFMFNEAYLDCKSDISFDCTAYISTDIRYNAASATSYAELFVVVFATWYAASATSYADFVQCLGFS